MAIDVPDLLSRSERIDCGEIRRHPFDLWTAQTIELDCGVSIKIADMHQFHTYSGTLCGFPRREFVDGHIEEAVQVARRIFPRLDIHRLAIFPPVISFGTTIKQVSAEMVRRLGLSTDIKEQRIAWEMLPKITTVAVLQMTTSFDSVLAIWWQGEVGYPDARVLEQIRKLPWADHVVENDP
jgi:hypothetical protein